MSSLLPNNKPIWWLNSGISVRFMAHALNTFYCRGALDIRGNPDTMGCVWTGEFDLNMLHVDGEIFKSGKKKLRIQKYLDTVWTGPKFCVFWRTRRLAATFSY